MQTATKKELNKTTLIIVMLFFLTLFAPLPYFLMAEQINNITAVEQAEQEQAEQAENEKFSDAEKSTIDDSELRNDELLLPDEPALKFNYPDAVRGLYVTGHTAGADHFKTLLGIIDSTDLNAMVIDIKDDWGYITYKLNGTIYDDVSRNFIKDPKALLKILSEHNIYPIARIVVFKDTLLATKHLEYSFLVNGAVWKNSRNEAFVNPFLGEVWEYNLQIAKEAAELGFQEIQFDYVRFPEGFEKRDKSLTYSLGNYTEEKLAPRIFKEWEELPSASRSPEPPGYSLGLARIMAVTDFVEYAKKQLEPYDVKVSVDIFGYTATIPESKGIGQNFLKISKNVDVISAMIYPSHWGPGYFGIPKPDKEPYRLVQEYVKVEKEILAELENPPISRPWIQDFTASWLGSGNYINYGKTEVEAQIKALNEGGINEFLLWNASNRYTPNVEYLPVRHNTDL